MCNYADNLRLTIMRVFIFSFLIFLTGCKAQHYTIEPQCSYLGRPIRDFVSGLSKPIKDTISSAQYTGHITSLYLKIDSSTTFEIIPDLTGSNKDSIRRPLNFGYFLNLPIKCIFLVKSGEIKKACNCKELAEWKNSRHDY